MDLPTLAAGLSVGVAVGAVLVYISLRSSFKEPHITEARAHKISKTLPRAKVIPRSELERYKKETNTLLLERELLSGALTRVYEAEVEKKITRDERDTLSAKYREQLKATDSKLVNHEAFIEVGELEILRDELFKLFEEKTTQIENRLDRAKTKLGERRPIIPPLEPEVVAPQPKEKTQKDEVKSGTEVHRKVDALREEVLEALARLEQMDIE